MLFWENFKTLFIKCILLSFNKILEMETLQMTVSRTSSLSDETCEASNCLAKKVTSNKFTNSSPNSVHCLDQLKESHHINSPIYSRADSIYFESPLSSVIETTAVILLAIPNMVLKKNFQVSKEQWPWFYWIIFEVHCKSIKLKISFS